MARSPASPPARWSAAMRTDGYGASWPRCARAHRRGARSTSFQPRRVLRAHRGRTPGGSGFRAETRSAARHRLVGHLGRGSKLMTRKLRGAGLELERRTASGWSPSEGAAGRAAGGVPRSSSSTSMAGPGRPVSLSGPPRPRAPCAGLISGSNGAASDLYPARLPSRCRRSGAAGPYRGSGPNPEATPVGPPRGFSRAVAL